MLAVHSLCKEVEALSELHCIRHDDERVISLQNVNRGMVERLHPLSQQLKAALRLPAVNTAMQGRISYSLDVLGEIYDELALQDMLCVRNGTFSLRTRFIDCW